MAGAVETLNGALAGRSEIDRERVEALRRPL